MVGSDCSQPRLSNKRIQLLDLIRGLESCAVAFSAGVDSSVLAKAAHVALGDRAVAVTGNSASLAEGELDDARSIAALIGIRHVIIDTDELANPSYARNADDRCYHCKTELYEQIERRLEELGVRHVLNGANLDDRSDYRPGMIAATQHSVRSPLLECGFSKADVRALASEWELPVWDKPASPCLSSRIAYGEPVTPERLRMVDRAERFLRDRGFSSVRVRYHGGDLARIEIAAEEIVELCEPTARRDVCTQLQELGFRYVTIDLQGFRSGNLNQLVSIDALRQESH